MSQQQTPSQDFEKNTRYFIWAAGLGMAFTLAIIGYAHANFMTKEVADERTKHRVETDSRLEKGLGELTREVKEMNLWLREHYKDAKK